MFYMSFLSFSDEVASKLSTSEKLQSILTTGIGGYLLVFVILALIWLILAIFGKFFDKTPKKQVSKSAPVTIEPETASAVPESDDGETVAAIVAAISAYTNTPAGGFKVVSFRKKH